MIENDDKPWGCRIKIPKTPHQSRHSFKVVQANKSGNSSNANSLGPATRPMPQVTNNRAEPCRNMSQYQHLINQGHDPNPRAKLVLATCEHHGHGSNLDTQKKPPGCLYVWYFVTFFKPIHHGQQRNQPVVPFGTTPLQLESLATHHRFNNARTHNLQEFRRCFHMCVLFVLKRTV